MKELMSMENDSQIKILGKIREFCEVYLKPYGNNIAYGYSEMTLGFLKSHGILNPYTIEKK